MSNPGSLDAVAIGQRAVRVHGARDQRGEEAIQQAAAQVLAAGLLSDGSAFTPDRSVWTPAAAAELVKAFVASPDAGSGDFVTKLHRQVGECSPAAVQLVAELQYLTILPLSDMTGEKKRSRLAAILSWLPDSVSVPTDLDAALDGGVFNGGMGFTVQGWRNFGVLISFVAEWKAAAADITEIAQRDPWKFRDFVMNAPGPNPAAARHELIYLAFPDVFEPIVNQTHKRKIRDAFVSRVGGTTGDLDRDLFAIRNYLEAEAGGPIEFYQQPYEDQWRTSKAKDIEVASNRRAWLVRGSAVSGANVVPEWLAEGFVSLAAAHLRLVDSDSSVEDLRAAVEADYAHLSYNQRKAKLAELQAFVLRMSPGDLVVTTSEGRVYVGRVDGDAVFGDADDARTTIRRDAVWDQEGVDFADLPESLQAKLRSSSTVVDLTDVAELVEKLLAEPEQPPEERPTVDVELGELPADVGEELLVGAPWLTKFVDLLRANRQVILYGPPGTGKTYLALSVAEALTDPANVALVQFHPAYSYEDFFEGYRPTPADDSGRIGFTLTPGPLRKIVDRATEDPGSPYILIIDEINRANLAKVFGELYFLLEYRDRSIDLMYGSGDEGRDFTLPKNLFIIGTMNTADRSIALVDAAMRRRFGFLSLHPDDEHLRPVLRTWLERRRLPTEPADLLDALNARIPDRNFKVGPAYLMKRGVTESGGVERIWETQILPLLEELHFGEDVDIDKRYGLPALRAKTSSSPDDDPSTAA